MVLHHEPPPEAAKAQREVAEASGVVEHQADDAGGYPTTQAVAEN
jgi:hypothetical protein